MNVLVCGDPTAPPYQVIFTGPHTNLRLGGRSREGVAFGAVAWPAHIAGLLFGVGFALLAKAAIARRLRKSRGY